MSIEPGQVYRHYKGKYYKIICLAKLEKDKVPQVVYQSQDDNLIWIRPESEWTEIIEYLGTEDEEGLDEQSIVRRFALLSDF